MVDVWRVRADWSGFPGAPGYTKFSFAGLSTGTAIDASVAAVRTFFNSCTGYMVPGTSIQVQKEIDVFDMATGTLLRTDVATTLPAVVTGAGASSAYAGGSGAVIRWKTGVVFNGRRLQGRTFFVPLVGAYETNGTLAAAAITMFQGAADALIATSAADFAIWGKQMTKTSPPVQIGGALSPATSASVPDRAAILRSRRD